ncbi:MAG: TonB-dependent receptor [Bacteroidetes bacterium]|nr:MAG: TonB-dependent receptor [Bacteroidota bacterium]
MNQFRIFIFSLLILFLNAANLNAQNTSVRIQVLNQKDQPVPYATLSASLRTDSLKIIKLTADSSGIAVFQLQQDQQYIIKFSAIGYLPFEKGITANGKNNRYIFNVENLSKKLDAVVITSKKPLMRQEDDKTIVDPENLVASSTTGFEVLEKVPGLFMDQDGNIYLNSTTPATVHINGREMKMSAADMASMLKSLPPNAIAKIEILKTPSAKYEASGSGGIVNVVLKKGVKLGMTGSVNGGFQQGVYGNQFMGFSLNNNDGKKRSYLNFSVNNRNNYEKVSTNRLLTTDTLLTQDAFTKYPGHGLYTNYGLIWSVGKKWEIEYDGSININKSKSQSENDNLIRKISDEQTLSNNLNHVNNQGNSFSISNGFESRYKIDSLGSEWENDIFTSYSDNKSNQVFNTTYNTPVIPASGGDGDALNRRYLFIGKSDLKLKLKKKLTVETGLRSSVHHFTNETEYFHDKNGIKIPDMTRTNTFKYTENINALYLQGSKTLGKDIVLKIGSRLENTNMTGNQQVPADTSFSIHRTDLFPYIYLSKPIVKVAGYELRAYLVYRRTIVRPGYEQLNPFQRYVDQYMTEVGNPSLQPQFTKNYEVNISADETPILAAGINDTKDIFTNVIYQSDTSAMAYRTYDNLGKNKEWYIRGMGAVPPGGKYFFVVGAQYNHNFYDGYYENEPLSYKRGSWMLFTYHTLKLDKRSQLSMNGFVRFKGLIQFTEVNTFGALNANINRRFMKDKLTVTLSVNDIFFTNKYDFSIKQGSVNAYGLRENDTRRFGMNFRYNFGIKKKEESKGMFDVDSPEGK